MTRYENRLRRGLRCALIALALTLAGMTLAPAALPYEAQTPANAMVAVGIPDTAGFWTKAQQLPLVKALQQFVDSPAVASSGGYKRFLLEKQKMEQQLGYPLTGEQFFQVIFSNLALFVTPAAEPKGEPSFALILGVKDEAKAAKMVQAMDTQNKQETTKAAVSATSGTAASAAPAAAAPKATFEQITIGGAKVSHFAEPNESGAVTKEAYYTVTGGRFLMSNSKAVITNLVQGQPAAQDLSKNPQFAQLAALLPWKEAPVAGWIDGDAIQQASGKGAILSAMPGLTKTNKVAFTADLQPDGILARVASPDDPARATAKLVARNLVGVDIIPPTPLMAGTYGVFNPDKFYQDLNTMLGMSGLGGPGGGGSPMAQFEQTTGISIQQDLVPALGSELTFSLNNFTLNMTQMPPFALDLALGAEVRDKAKMQVVMQKLETLIEKQAAQMQGATMNPNQPQGTPAGPPKFKTVGQGPVTVRSIELGLPGVSPCYALQDKFVIISLNPQTLSDSLKRISGNLPSVRSTPAYKTLKDLAGTDKLYSYGQGNVGQLLQAVIAPMLPLMMQQVNPAQQQTVTQFMTQVLPHVSTVSMLETQKNNAVVGFVKVGMQ